MEMSAMKLAALCCVLVLTTGLQRVSNSDVEDKQKDESDSKDHALVALDTEDSDEDVDGVTPESFLTENAEIFKPTKQWQTVKPGQAIPRGLHIRMNLQTGDREAKLLDENEDSNVEDLANQSQHERLKEEIERAVKELELEQTKKEQEEEEEMKYWKTKGREGMINLKKTSFTTDELKQALKKFKSERDDVQDENIKAESAKKSFRTMDEIREDFRRLNIDMKTDLEILTHMMSRFKSGEMNAVEHLALLSELEYYVHQIDNAQNFADMNGIDFLIRDLNSTSEEIRKEAALVLGSAVQSNPKVQVIAVESGAMQKLIRMLSLEPSTAVRIRVLTALSSLIRNFPFAQQKFLELGGLDSLTLLLRQPEISEKLCVKAVTLVSDLLVEQFTTKDDLHIPAALRTEKLSQYSRVPFLESIIELGWCELVPRLLDLSDHDSKEKVLSAMWTLKDGCSTDFARSLPRLMALRKEYKELSRQEMEEDGIDSSDSYFNSVLLHSVDRLVKHVAQAKDEL